MYRQDDPEVNFDQLTDKFRSIGTRLPGKGGGFLPLLILGGLLIVSLLWLGSGVYTVQPGEQAATRLLGDFQTIEEPGLKWWFPSPIGNRDIIRVNQVRTLELGFREINGEGTSVLAESMMITGDENIVETQMVVQYDIKNLKDYLFEVVDPDGSTMKDVAETAIREVVGSRNIDDVLTTEKSAVQAETKLLMQNLLDEYKSGVNIREVKLQSVSAPMEVRDAFDDVVRAREEKSQIVNLAQAYQEDQIPRAKGDAARVLEGSEAFKQERIADATGQAEKFLEVLKEYEKAPDITRQRLYLESMEKILPGVKKYIISETVGGNMLQFLPLDGSTQTIQTIVDPQGGEK